MKTNIHFPQAWHFPLLAFLLFLLLKAAYSMAEVQHLTFLLAPSSEIVATFTGTGNTFIPDQGYFNESLNILINKSCSGFNFWSICFLMSYCLLAKPNSSWFRNLILLPLVLGAAYLFTILVNSTRILFSIFLHSADAQLLAVDSPWSHQAEGVFIYLSYLIIAYLSIDYFQTQKPITL
ncbi:MAG: exosortase K [Saprospiraceae bacterium]|nr:exosortase K [Saprospiraceae bacterium]